MASPVHGAVSASIATDTASLPGHLLGFDENLFFVTQGEKLIGMGKAQPIICAECNTPIADIVGASILIAAKHHGEHHKTLIPIKDILKVISDEQKNFTVL